jgi:DNA-binding PadR family transcriptional regulator
MKELTKLEEVVMIACWKLGNDAYGVKIKKKVKEIVGREYFYNTLYTTFEQLVRKGYLSKHFSEPTAVRGGKRKVLFTLTNEGQSMLKQSYERQQRIWGGFTKETFQSDYLK